jgi:ABC-type glycerol-3-phosphate transport system substrate-binding protein
MKGKLFASIAIALLLVISVASRVPAIGFAAGPVQENEPVTLRVMDWAAGGEDFWKSLDSSFTTKYPWITIEHEFIPYDAYFDKFGAYVAAGDGPCLIQQETGLGLLKYEDVLLPLNDYVEPELMDSLVGTEAFCQDFDCSKNIYGLPHTAQAQATYYNKNVFREAGLDPDKPPTTWREMDAACQAIKAIGKDCMAFGGRTWHADWVFSDLPVNLLDAEQMRGLYKGTLKWTDPEMTNLWRLFEVMNQRGWFAEGAASMGVDPEAVDMFARGEAGFFESLTSDYGNWKMWDDRLGPDNYGVMKWVTIECDYPLEGVCPGPLDGSLPLGGGIVFGIPKWCQNVDEAVLYAKYVVSPEMQTKFTIEGGAYPGNKNVDITAIPSPQLQQIAEWYQNPDNALTAWVFMWPEEWDGLHRNAQLILLGQEGAEDAAKDMQAIHDSRR